MHDLELNANMGPLDVAFNRIFDKNAAATVSLNVIKRIDPDVEEVRSETALSVFPA